MAGHSDAVPFVDLEVWPNDDNDINTNGTDTGGSTTESHEKDQFLSDGQRRINYIIAYNTAKEDEEDTIVRRKERWEFLENLKGKGLELEPELQQVEELEEIENEAGGKTIFIKIHVPWDTMLHFAEVLKFKKPVDPKDIEDESAYERVVKMLTRNLDPRFIKPEPMFFRAPFSMERQYDFIVGSKEKFFTPAERSRVVHEILERAGYDSQDKTKFGIDHMIANKSFAAAFPLHDGPYHYDWEGGKPMNDRSLLYEDWAKPGSFYRKQPLNAIRRYFGEKIGLYFAWLGSYTLMLLFPAVIGLLIFLGGWGHIRFDAVSADICNANNPGNFTMCPQCSGRCPYWLLSSSCVYAKLTHIFDNRATVAFALIMSLWATMFCEVWKRRQNQIDYDWDLFGFEEQEENCRHQYEVKASENDKRTNPVTKELEVYMALTKRFPRIMAAGMAILFMICLVLASVIAIIIYRIAIKVTIAAVSENIISSNASLITSCTASLLSLVVIMLLQILYDKIATGLTDFELHRTDTEYEDAYTVKMYLFAFVNYYSASFYIAFVKGKLPGNPSDYGKIFGYRQEECDPAGCLQELFINIAIVMCGKQFFNNFMEIFVPKALNIWRSRIGRAEEEDSGDTYDQWERDYNLGSLGPQGLFKEYLEMTIQFGFITIFAAAFPLAPLFALINNIMEIRVDAYKFVTQLRRPYAAKAQDIGAWYGILVTVGNIAVLTNAFIIAFTSEFVPREVYRARHDSLSGYIDYSLSSFNTLNFETIRGEKGPNDANDDYPVEKGSPYYAQYFNQTVTVCRYRGFYKGPNPPYDYTPEYWTLLAWKLVFVLLFEHIVFAIKFALDYVIPDMPEHVKNTIKRESYLAQKALHDKYLQKRETEPSTSTEMANPV
ncbi:anoctamin-4-like isoform X2 [Amphiura filiformis]|uniref:anoctamin-4-like isoform X2 n=1 Tax=Amphiura filiformis TaxID=82378 RepID=UPI003B21465A